MPKTQNPLLSDADDKSAKADGQVRNCGSSFSERIQDAAATLGMTQGQLARASGVPSNRVNEYWKGPKEPTAPYLFDLAAALGVNAEWLALGRGPRQDSAAGRVEIGDRDFRALGSSVDSSGETISIPRSWLAETFSDASGLWTVRLQVDYPAIGIGRGQRVLCRDVEIGELADGDRCLFAVNGGVLVGRFSFRAAGSMIAMGDQLGEHIVTKSEIGQNVDQYMPVGLIVGVLLRSI